MAIQHPTGGDPTPSSDQVHTEVSTSAREQTLQPREYVQWLLSLERQADIPPSVRAYVVYIDHEGQRRIRPVAEGASIVNLRTELQSHLRAGTYSPDFFIDLRDFCDSMLAGADRRLANDERAHLALSCSWEIESTAMLLRDQLDEDAGVMPLRTMLRRIARLAQAQMSLLDEPEIPLDEVKSTVEG